ncbi:nuclear transport factor 2 family protein [Vibrio diabolicus]|nr:nuclear transport factor 2 family protein [Vibrio diabolicus]MCG9232525.1 nuclear transport factor 2 family protein [Vibrio diabolicus]MCG9574575.1 nuclear transport factor 2 family protein [Vibrio diabolicus]MCG9594624.1 nuclear transport factor 2 family protein [Vibrio diabolicus]MCG9775228.1 nuclear transport factor 2 family protein [Vibrio diabolicus]
MDILIEQEIELHQYEIRQSKTDIERLIHPSFVEVGKSGTSYDFDSIIEMMDGEESSSTRIHSQRYECIHLEPSVQLLRYDSALVSESGEVSDFAKRCSIWAFTGTC